MKKEKTLTSLLPEELNQKLIAKQQELNKLQFTHAINPLENPMLLSKTRKTIARIKTLQNDRKNKR